MKTVVRVSSAVGLGGFNADRSGEGDSNDGYRHQQFASHGSDPASFSPSDFVIG
jgi:hypothetical protein